MPLTEGTLKEPRTVSPQNETSPQRQSSGEAQTTDVDTSCKRRAASVGDMPTAERAKEQHRTASPERTTPALNYTGRWMYATNLPKSKEAVDALITALDHQKFDLQPNPSEPCKALGFDIEWVPSFKKGVTQGRAATVQLATDDLAVVFQLSEIGSMPPPLADLLSRADVLKVGVGPVCD